MMSATPMPSKPCLRNSVLATSTTFSRFAAACSRDTFINQPPPLYKISIDIIHDVRHEYIYMMDVINIKKERNYHGAEKRNTGRFTFSVIQSNERTRVASLWKGR